MSELLDLNVGLRQEYILSPWLFIVHMDEIIREVRDRGSKYGSNCEEGEERK